MIHRDGWAAREAYTPLQDLPSLVCSITKGRMFLFQFTIRVKYDNGTRRKGEVLYIHMHDDDESMNE